MDYGLQVAHPPKYADVKQEYVFREYSHQGPAPALAESTTFLYNKSQTSGGEKGGKGEGIERDDGGGRIGIRRGERGKR